MEFKDVMKTRRSIKAFDQEHTMSDEELRQILQLTALSPSSYNLQNWHFVAVRDQEIKDQLQAASWNQQQVGSASVVIVIAGDLTAQDHTDRILRNLPEETQRMMDGMIKQFYSGNEPLIRQEACRSAGIAGMALMLAAVDMGYGSCPMIGFDPTQVAGILRLPESHPPVLMVPIGKPATPARPRMGLKNLEELVSLECYGNHDMKGDVPE